MKKKFMSSIRFKALAQAVAVMSLLSLAENTFAQQGSQGNTTIFGGAEMTVFGAHSFATGGGGVQPGIVNTIRTAPYGVLNFGTAASQTGANDANHVDGYVRKLGTTSFIFPVGDNGQYGPFAAEGDGTTGAYFHVDPSSAITSMVGGGNYPVLPTGGPFATSSKDANVTTVSTKEYWDIDGATATKITLTWDGISDVTTLTGSSLTKLGIVGWDGTKWVKIPATVDATSVLGGTSSLTAGSITTTATIVPNTYTAYTLASVVNIIPDLTPTTDIKALSFAEGESRDFIVNLYEINGGDATGAISFRLNKLSAFNITYPTTNTTSSVFDNINTDNENGNWTFTETASLIIVTAKPGVTIPAGGQAKIGFTATRKPGIPGNTTQNLTVTIVGRSGGETNTDNNVVITSITAIK
ncbi:hypothetical protein BWI93_12480 [Siphonobacter sp. BAB-5385]|uniref:hypothetical protein n=1 Tax=Siphonobacter sp. BAB-5385 TaxID=1864822 RepID=UPI000B9E2BE9|nr:hypothetical protein [Siphonobacter sp. BAB-5385]OZI07837.1 hypothetical protein BWI93_12480 [Siphonobacter sp. BAB-5385]